MKLLEFLLIITMNLTACSSHSTAPWVSFTTPDKILTVEIPKKPKSRTKFVAGRIPVRMFTISQDGFSYILSVMKVPKQSIKKVSKSQLLTAATRSGVQRIKGKLVSNRTIYESGFLGRQIKVISKDKLLYGKIILANNKMLMVLVECDRDDEDDPNISQFLDSVTITPQPVTSFGY